ncbi:MAG: methylmalonyl-CoA mutase family protein [Litorimonas sp.]
MTELILQSDFPNHSRKDWRNLAEKGLRDADFATLSSETEDGITRGPLFDADTRPDDHARHPRGDAPLLSGRPWHICAPVMDRDAAFANAQLLADLKGGASAVRLMGQALNRKADLKRCLEGVLVGLVPVIFEPGNSAATFASSLDDLTNTPVTLGLDPLGDRPDVPDTWRAFTANAAAIHETGGTDALELAGFAATTAAAFKRHGPAVHDHMSALFAVGTDAHLNIVKLRAARRLYASIAEAYGIETASIPIHAITSLRMMQSQDAWTNMLRTMSAGFGAVTGGADYITVRPFTETSAEHRRGNPTPFGYRIARNQQLLMMEESHIGQVRDVAYGSYFHERLTEDLAQLAWAKFQSIEADGGIETYLSSGAFKTDCEAAKLDREARDAPVLGVTLHPSVDAPKPEVRG